MATEASTLAAGETCQVLAIVPSGKPANCRKPRSCQSCLQKEGCMVDTSGMCTINNTTQSNKWSDYRIAYQAGLVLPNATSIDALAKPQAWFFPATVAKYCAADDAVCADCIKHKFWLPSATADSRFCVGKNDCVCIANCEDGPMESICSDEFPSTTQPVSTPAAAESSTKDSSSSLSTTTVVVVVAVVVALAVGGFVARKLVKRRRAQAQQPPFEVRSKNNKTEEYVEMGKATK